MTYDETPPYPDFDVIAEHQGWTTETMLFICRDFIARNLGSDLLGEYAQSIADDENHPAGTS